MLYKYNLRTETEGFYNVSAQINESLKKSGIENGICVVFCPHTTAGMTINENADPDVVTDMLFALKKTIPDRPEFTHFEGNTTAHLKSSLMGSSVTVIIQNKALVLGTWQSVYFCEFDGPRSRTFYVKVIEG
ncbi:MAG TPA: secondary thiamine-phosphate synthase enzyme YjbQ [Thermoclostridium sp.]|nr:secondary thiamine-phosphate synthase enzyme YjbQ [Thermoclostridium sp.]